MAAPSRSNRYILIAAATMAAFGAASAYGSDATPAPTETRVVPNVPLPTPVTTPEERLERTVRNLFELIKTPDPRYATFTSVGRNTRVLYVSAKNDVNARFRLVEGEEARKSLTEIYGPQSKGRIVFGDPDIQVSGALGRLTVHYIEIETGGKRSLCSVLHITALREYGNWNIIEMVFAPSYSMRDCPKP